MKGLFIATLLFLSAELSFGQSAGIKGMIDSLPFMQADAFDDKADLYWRIIAKGKEAIPFLIERLDDSILTNIQFHCKKTNLNVGEVAHFALAEIGDFPPLLVTGIKFDLMVPNPDGTACWNFYEYLFNKAAKAKYKKSMTDWYAREKGNYKAVKISNKDKTENQRLFGIETYYRWKG